MRDLVNGAKELLLSEFDKLYPIHGRKWRSRLKKVNPWHSTDTGLQAWRNISKGTTGNEALRLILADMNAVVNTLPVESTIRKQGLTRSVPKSLQDKYPAAHRAARKRASHQKPAKINVQSNTDEP